MKVIRGRMMCNKHMYLTTYASPVARALQQLLHMRSGHAAWLWNA